MINQLPLFTEIMAVLFHTAHKNSMCEKYVLFFTVLGWYIELPV